MVDASALSLTNASGSSPRPIAVSTGVRLHLQRALARRRWEHEPNGEYLSPSAGKSLDGFRGVTANFARIDLYACNNTNPQKRAGP